MRYNENVPYNSNFTYGGSYRINPSSLVASIILGGVAIFHVAKEDLSNLSTLEIDVARLGLASFSSEVISGRNEGLISAGFASFSGLINSHVNKEDIEATIGSEIVLIKAENMNTLISIDK